MLGKVKMAYLNLSLFGIGSELDQNYWYVIKSKVREEKVRNDIFWWGLNSV